MFNYFYVTKEITNAVTRQISNDTSEMYRNEMIKSNKDLPAFMKIPPSQLNARYTLTINLFLSTGLLLILTALVSFVNYTTDSFSSTMSKYIYATHEVIREPSILDITLPYATYILLAVLIILLFRILFLKAMRTKQYQVLAHLNIPAKYMFDYQKELFNETNLTLDETDKLTKYNNKYYNMKDNLEYTEGNLNILPLSEILKVTGIKSVKNFIFNMEYLNKFYNENYISKLRASWINETLNAFYLKGKKDNNMSIDYSEVLENLK